MKLSFLKLVFALSSLYAVCVSGDSKVDKKAASSYIEVTDVRGYKALVLVPTDMTEADNGKLPTILFLHGIGESGSDLNLLKLNGFPRNLEGDDAFPFIFIMPQCPIYTEWYYTNVDNVTAMRTFLDDLILRFPIDTNRIYITGLSMGGIGSWYFTIKMPTRFAALLPVSFRGDGWSPAPAVGVPVWAFHGAKDNVIPLANAQALVDQFIASGGNIRFTIYPDGGHDGSTWTVTYNNPDVYDWMLRKRKPAPISVVEKSEGTTLERFLLGQNHPNPFNPVTQITFSPNSTGLVVLTVYNMLGQTITELFNGVATANRVYTCSFDGKNMPSGIYLYVLRSESGNEVKKMCLLK